MLIKIKWKYSYVSFKFYVQFDEKGDELEKIISYFLISQLEKYSTIKKNKI